MDFNVVARLGLLLVRPGMVVMITPGFGGIHAPALVKVGLTVLLALALAPSVPISPVAGPVPLSGVILREAAIGLCLAFVVRALIAGAELGGHLAGFQIGFSYGATIDPQSGVRNTMLATLYGSIATLGFLAINGHHEVLRALDASYAALPIGGGGMVDGSLVGSVRDMLGLVFVVGVRIAAPIVIVLLLVEVGVALVARSSPALNFMVIGYPLRLVVGLLLLAALVPTVPAVTNSLVERAVVLAADAASAFR